MFNSPWQFIDTGFNTGAFNMQFDEMLAQRLQERDGIPTLRLFRWKPWAISVGYHQDTAELDVEKCARSGIDVVRRQTGGRAVLHADELTYSVTLYAGGKSVLQVYNDISRALVRGLRLFGVSASLRRLQPDVVTQYKHPSSLSCFTSSARYEIEWRGRKLVGSAQRRFGNAERDVVLQHGSILCGPAHRRLSEYLSLSEEATLDQLTRSLREKTVDLSEIRGGAVDIEDLASCIKKGFELEWNVTFVYGNTSYHQQQPVHV